MDPVLELKHITKRYPLVIANQDVSLKIYPRTVHALVGENGAGKTTLMNIIYGLTKPDYGSVILKGNELPTAKGYIGLEFGIGMIHQHFMLVGAFTALENIILGCEPQHQMFLDIKSAREKVRRIMQRYNLEVDIDKRVEELSVGEEQKVEILKVLYRDAEIIIMDEPTAVLTPQETRQLFQTMRMLVEGGKTVIFITHKLEEVMAVSQVVTVMRAGRVLKTCPTAETNTSELAELMVGRKIQSAAQRATKPGKKPLLKLDRVSLIGRKGEPLLTEVTFEVRQGEIFGICGVEGNGQEELFEVIVGVRKPQSGRIEIAGEDLTLEAPGRRHAKGLAHIPPDRRRTGIISGLTVAENLIVGRHKEKSFSKVGFLKKGEVETFAYHLIDRFEIQPRSPNAAVSVLSGGNQQKVVIARELSRDPLVLVASQPTRGLDVSATRLIHNWLVSQADAGKAVLLISADLSEILSLSDRIGVLYKGKLLRIVDRAETNEEDLGLLMAGVHT